MAKGKVAGGEGTGEYLESRPVPEWERRWNELLRQYGSLRLALPAYWDWVESRNGGKSARTRFKRKAGK
jgi:hypothetical protein